MKQFIKKIISGLAVIATMFAIAGCYSSSEHHKATDGRRVQYARTHQNEGVVNSHAKMYQTYGEKERLGTIKFHETDAGLDVEIIVCTFVIWV